MGAFLLEKIMSKIIEYPVIMTKHSKGNFSVSSPNIPGMKAKGKIILQAYLHAIKSAETVLEGKTEPKVFSVRDWKLKDNQKIFVIPVRVKS